MTINLLPEKIKQERKLSGLLSYINLTIFSIILLLTLFYLVLLLVKSDLLNTSSGLTNQSATERALISHYESIEADIGSVNRRLNIISEISKVKPSPSNMLLLIAESTPGNLSIGTIALDSVKNTVSISGLASSRKDIATLKEKIEALELFENVLFNTSVYNTTNQNYTFALTAGITK